MSVEAQYRRFLLLTAAATYLAAAVELVLVEHYEDVWQFVPLVVIVAGVGAIAWSAARPTPASIRALWLAGGLAVVTSLLGVVLHVKGNAEFALEIDPDLSVLAAVWDGLDGGNPFLAPGMIALAGVLGAAAGWRHRSAGSARLGVEAGGSPGGRSA